MMSQHTQVGQGPSVVEEDPVRAIRNSIERMEKLLGMTSSVATVRQHFEEEKALMEKALQRIQPT